MSGALLLLPIVVPFAVGVLCLVLPKRAGWSREALALAATGANLCVVIPFFGRLASAGMTLPGLGFELSLRLYHFSSFILLATAGFGLLISLYSVLFMRTRPAGGQYYFYLLVTVSFTNGAALADNLVLLLFFWEGLLLTMFGMIVGGRKESFRTATKAFIIVGATDLCLMFGTALTGSLAGTLTLSHIHLAARGPAAAAFVLMMIGAVGKAGAMPFHSWIPDAAVDAPLPFMAFLPAALEKLLGIYLLARISLDLFEIVPGSWLSLLMMILGAVTILLAVMMALAQKDYKRLLSYHAISQVGYMVLGIGTALPIGIVGGLFHMINHAMYKSGLFLTGGAVERQAGTTSLSALGGLGRKMPVTFACFIVTAAAISGIPPLNGFFSKELIYEGALERGWPFYLAAVVGSFFTAASFLKLGHAAYLGVRRAKSGGTSGVAIAAGDVAAASAHATPAAPVREAPWPMLVPMVVITALCALFGIYNPLPLRGLIEPILGARLGAESFAGLPRSAFLVGATLVVLGLALLNHLYGVRRSGSGAGAADHIVHAPVLGKAYESALRGRLDPYNWARVVVTLFARAMKAIDRAVDWVYETLVVRFKSLVSWSVARPQTGNFAHYILWVLLGAVLVALFVVR